MCAVHFSIQRLAQLLTGLMLIASVARAGEAGPSLVSPMDYQVFQRQTPQQGAVRVSGQNAKGCDAVQVRLSGEKQSASTGFLSKLVSPSQSSRPVKFDRWIPVAVEPQTGLFNAVLQVPAGGWYRLEVRAMNGKKAVGVTTIEHFGVGEVFVGAGQSNSVNWGEELLKTETQMVSTFSGTEWRLADDPQPGTHDKSTGGSFWPVFGDAMYRKYQVPIGVAVTGHTATGLNDWKEGGEFFNWMMTRVLQLGPGGFRALLWHQGEYDAKMPQDEYRDRLANIIAASKREAGWEFPWFVARASYNSPAKPAFDNVRNGQKALWDTGIALEGPDTDILTGDTRELEGKGIHFSGKGLRAHGQMWFEKVSPWLDRVLKDE